MAFWCRCDTVQNHNTVQINEKTSTAPGETGGGAEPAVSGDVRDEPETTGGEGSSLSSQARLFEALQTSDGGESRGEWILCSEPSFGIVPPLEPSQNVFMTHHTS